MDRSGGRTEFPYGRGVLPFFACLELHLPAYEEGACPLCAAGGPLTVT